MLSSTLVGAAAASLALVTGICLGLGHDRSLRRGLGAPTRRWYGSQRFPPPRLLPPFLGAGIGPTATPSTWSWSTTTGTVSRQPIRADMWTHERRGAMTFDERAPTDEHASSGGRRLRAQVDAQPVAGDRSVEVVLPFRVPAPTSGTPRRQGAPATAGDEDVRPGQQGRSRGSPRRRRWGGLQRGAAGRRSRLRRFARAAPRATTLRQSAHRTAATLWAVRRTLSGSRIHRGCDPTQPP
jgi:hypothetical protein